LLIQEKKTGATRPAKSAPADRRTRTNDGGAHPLTPGQGLPVGSGSLEEARLAARYLGKYAGKDILRRDTWGLMVPTGVLGAQARDRRSCRARDTQ
jgi:hypothetical protein